MLNHQLATSENYPEIMSIWEKSVVQTHEFLTDADREFYKQIIPDILPQVEVMLWFDEDTLIGFSGIQDRELAMLFLDPEFIGQHFGSEIIQWLIDNKEINRVSVNEQNKAAYKFYEKFGFRLESRDEKDGFDKPYPIANLLRTI